MYYVIRRKADWFCLPAQERHFSWSKPERVDLKPPRLFMSEKKANASLAQWCRGPLTGSTNWTMENGKRIWKGGTVIKHEGVDSEFQRRHGPRRKEDFEVVQIHFVFTQDVPAMAAMRVITSTGPEPSP